MGRSCVLYEVGTEVLYAMEVNTCISFERFCYDTRWAKSRYAVYSI